MNDWWNDPPEDEPDRIPDGPDPLYDTLEEKEQAYGEPIEPALCPHGNPWGQCNECDFWSDLAYDAWREKK